MSEQPNSDNSRQDALRTARKQITRSLLLSLAALGVIVIACYAWFVRNTTVSGALGSISAGGSTFELASVGTEGAFDNVTPEEWKVDGTEATYRVENSALTVFQTDEKDAILWRLSAESNLGNQSGNLGIKPGSHGTLQFYIIPKQTGPMTLSFTLDLIPMVEKAGSITRSEDSTADQLLRGHLLFSYECTQDTDYTQAASPTLLDFQNRSFSLTFESAFIDTPIPVKLNWVWPELLKDVKEGTLHGVCSKEPVLERMTIAPGYFFCNNGVPVTVSPNLETQFKNYNDYFNNADQYIGEHLDWLMVQLSAQQT